jgi:hypothetical protein
LVKFSKALAEKGFAEVSLAAENRRLVSYWLSLWEVDELPQWRHYDPSRVRDLLPGIAIMEIKASTHVRMKLSGSAVNAAFGHDLSGQDVLAVTKESDRATRLARNSQIAEGCASWAIRKGHAADGREWFSEEVQLPFRDVLSNDARLILFHTTWRPSLPSTPIIDPVNGLGLVEEWRIIDLRRDVTTTVAPTGNDLHKQS